MSITQIQAVIAPSLAVGGETFAAGTALTFTRPTRLLIPAATGSVVVVTNDGSALTISVIAGYPIDLSVVSVGAGSTVGGVGLW